MSEALRGLIEELIQVLAPLIDASQDSEGLKDLLDELGWQPDSLPESVSNLATVSAELMALVRAGLENSSMEQSFGAVKHLIQAIDDIRTAEAFPTGIDATVFKATIGRDLLDYLVAEHLLSSRHEIGGVLKLAGVIRLTQTAPSGQRQGYLRREVLWERIGDLLQDPASSFVEAFGWSTATPNVIQPLSDLASVLESYGLRLRYFKPQGELLAFINTGSVATLSDQPGVELALESPETLDGVAVGTQLVVLPPTVSRPVGIALFPYAALNGVTEIPLTETVSVTIGGNADFAQGIAIILVPGATPDVQLGFLGGTPAGQGEMHVALKVVPEAGQTEIRLLGTADASRFAIGGAQFSVGAQLAPTGKEVHAGLDVDDARVVIKPAPDEADSFLGKLLGPDGISCGFSLGMQLSSVSGFHFKGSGVLEINLPLHLALGPIQLDAITLGLKPASKRLDVEIGATVSGEIGPIAIAVEGAGLKVSARSAENGDGNLGSVDLVFGFKPPKGVGVAVDAGGISGGGFIKHEEADQSYAGVLALNFGDIALTAVGLITTRLPGGKKKGYALFLNIGVTFSPVIQLPYNFNLSGCGGLLALNRSLDVEALRSGLKNHTLDSILFPTDPIKNASKIISDSERVFPIEEGRFVVGPMAKFGWSAQNLIQADVAIVIEVPSPIVIALLGKITAQFPNPTNPQVVLHLDVLGVIEFEKQLLSIDAVLYDSRIVTYDLSGESALRLKWGSNPQFAMSVGGFHPRFSPPPKFPTLARLKLQLSSSDSFDLSCTAYQALTSNSLQFGAGLRLKAEACGVDIDGGLSMDTLFVFSPFSFATDISGHLAARYKGYDIASVALALALSGPNPWHAQGKARVSVACFSVTARFSKTWGHDEAVRLPSVNPLQQFLDELQLAGNWGSGLMPEIAAVEALRSPIELSALATSTTTASDATGGGAATGAGTSSSAPAAAPPPPFLVLHPAGDLQVTQRVVPLGIKLEKFGNADVTGNSQFDFSLQLGNAALDLEQNDREDDFARGQFKNLSNSERLSKPSYEKFKSGVSVRPALPRVDGKVEPCPLEYESIVVGVEVPRATVNARAEMSWTGFGKTAGAAAWRQASLRKRGTARFSVPGSGPRVEVAEEAYVIVDKGTLARAVQIQPDTPGTEPLNQTQAEERLKQYEANHPEAVGTAMVVPECEAQAS